MARPFDYFVIFAEMRTGSNFLEANLNAFDGIDCHGEAFNPHFIGFPGREDLLGVTQAERDENPRRLLRAIRKQSGGIGGFRFFNDHDPRVLDHVLEDRRCAKIVLTRNPVDSYVSWKIAQQTGQWKLTNVTKRKDSKARFDRDEFEAHLARLQEFQVSLMRALQTSGQTAYYIAYEDLQDIAVMNGLATFLGVEEQREAINRSLKRQNPEPALEKVDNPDEMRAALARLDRFNLTRTPNFEPRRGPLVPSYSGGLRTPLLYMPIRSGPEATVLAWLAGLDDGAPGDLATGFNQRSLRTWKEERPGHRSFTVIRHPVARAHAAFCRFILPVEGGMQGIRRTLRRAHGMDLPDDWPDPGWDLARHRAQFAEWLRFLKANLAGQTGVRVDGHWATQAQCLQGMAEYTLPDMIVREDEMAVYLPALAQQVGHPAPGDPAAVPAPAPFALSEVYDDEIEALAREAYPRDYIMFGFADWGGAPGPQAA